MVVTLNCYKKRRGETLSAGDFVFVNTTKADAALTSESYYVAKIEFFEKRKNQVYANLRYYYWAAETPYANRKFFGEKELLESPIILYSNVKNIGKKCKIHSLKVYTQLEIGDDDFYCRFYLNKDNVLELVGGGKIDGILVYCTCHVYNPDKDMVSCDKCCEWFHFDCIGLRPEEVDKDAPYVCEKCRDEKRLKCRDEKRLRMSKSKWLKESFDMAMMPLNEEQKQEVEEVFSRPSSDIAVIDMDRNIQITVKKFTCLQPSTWLNDEIINAYFQLLMEKEKRDPNNFLKCLFLSTFFYVKLDFSDHKPSINWTYDSNVSDYDKIFVPINVEEVHWAMVVIDTVEQKLMFIDSLKSRASGVDPVGMMRKVATYYKHRVLSETRKDVDIDNWEFVEVKDNPKQENCDDCGLFMIKCADFISRGLPLLFCQKDMTYFRIKTAYEILKLHVD